VNNFSNIDEESEKRSSLEMLRSEFETFLRRLEAEWVAERDSEPMDIEDGKFILESACEEVLDFRAQIVCDGKTSLKALQRYHLTIGGESFREFWKQGSQIVDLKDTRRDTQCLKLRKAVRLFFRLLTTFLNASVKTENKKEKP